MYRAVGVTLVFVVLNSSVYAQAGEAVKGTTAVEAKTGLSEILGKLDWGSSLTDVLKDAQGRLEGEWKGEMKVLDTFGMDRLRRQKKTEFTRIKASLRRFDGQSTGYESSIIADETMVGKNEAVLEQIISNQSRYYFFRNERLWKIAVVFDAGSAKGFNGFIKLLRRVFRSKPVSYEHVGKGRNKKRVSARWQSKLTIATARDLRSFYNAFLVRFVQRNEGETFQLERVAAKKTSGDQAEKSALIGDLFDEKADTVGEAGENLVDDLTGSRHEVDLTAGRLEVTRPTPQFQDEGPASKKPSAKKKKKSAKKVAPNAQPVSKPAKMVY